MCMMKWIWVSRIIVNVIEGGGYSVDTRRECGTCTRVAFNGRNTVYAYIALYNTLIDAGWGAGGSWMLYPVNC